MATDRCIWVGRFQLADGRDIRGAAMAADQTQFRTSIIEALIRRFQVLDRVIEASPLGPAIASDQAAEALALQVLRSGAPAIEHADNPPTALVADRLLGLEPLDAQFGVYPLRTVPEQLEDWLYPNDQATLFAVIDGSKVEGLPDLLSSLGLTHRSLFAGDAVEEYGSSGPWLVALERDSILTRRLFTKLPDDGIGFGLWDAAPAIFIRTLMTPDALRHHLRRFLRVPLENGSWSMFRFYDPVVFEAYLSGIADWPIRLRHWFMTADGERIERVIAITGAGQASFFDFDETALPPEVTEEPRPAFRLTDRDRIPLRALVRRNNIQSMARDLKSLLPEVFDGRSQQDVDQSVHLTVARLQPYGITHCADLLLFAGWDGLFGHDFEHRDGTGYLASILRSNQDGRRKAALVKAALKGGVIG